MLARAGFRDDARLAHAFREQDLADRVVDLVSAGMKEVFALEIDFGAAKFAREPFGEIKRGGPAAEFAQIIFQFALKLGVLLRAHVLVLQLLQGMHERLGNKAPAVRPEVALGVRNRSFYARTHCGEI